MDFTTTLPKLIKTTGTYPSEGGEIEIVLCFIFVFLASVMVIAGLAGNSIIIAAIMRERRLHTRGNYFIGSLAATDFLVSLLVCPFSALMTLQQISPVSLSWNPRWVTCQIFITLDVTCCTASILHLCAIAIDRCKSVTKLRYRTKIRFEKVLPYIVAIWSLAILLSLSPHFIFPLINASDSVSASDNTTKTNAEHSGDDILQDISPLTTVEMQNTSSTVDSELTGLNCIVNNNKYYRIAATTIAFYFPLLIIVVIYCHVSRIAWYRIHRVTGDKPICKGANVTPSTYSEFNSESFQVKLMEMVDDKSYQNPGEPKDTLLTMMCQKASKLCSCRTKMAEDSQLHVASKTARNVQAQDTSKLFCDDYSKASHETLQMSPRSCCESLKNAESMSDRINEHSSRKQQNFNETSTFCIDNNNIKTLKLSGIVYNNKPTLPRLQITPASEENSSNIIPKPDDSRQVYSSLLPRRVNEIKCSSKDQYLRSHRNGSITSEVLARPQMKISRSRSLISSKDISTRRRAFSINSLAEARTRITLRRERKIIKTMGMVIGGFVICWLPFFLKEIILPFCDTCYLSPGSEIVINWLGYMNSALNPFIYAFSNNDFNQAIRKLFRKSKCFKNLPTRL